MSNARIICIYTKLIHVEDEFKNLNKYTRYKKKTRWTSGNISNVLYLPQSSPNSTQIRY